jgi:hypothetical protein
VYTKTNKINGFKMKELGYLYVLANSAMPDMVKVGKTTRSSSERAVELSKATGLPTPFIVVYEQLFADCGEAESFVHVYLETQGYRVADNREFFNAPVSVVVKAIALAPNAIDNDSLTPEPEEEDDLLEHSGEPDELDDLSLEPTYPWTAIFEEAKAHYYGYDDYIQDYSEALRLFKQAAKLGSLPAYGYIGRMYENGEGVREDKNKALEFYKEGARKGSAYCYWAMAMLFMFERNDINAEKCFTLFLKNKPSNKISYQGFQRLTPDEHSDIITNCSTLGVFQVNRGWSIPSILNNFIIENLISISEKTLEMLDYCVEINNLEAVEECKLTLQYFESLAKA